MNICLKLFLELPLKPLLSVSLSALLLNACALEKSGSGKAIYVPVPQTYLFDGVKQVSSAVQDGADPKSMTQFRYSISTNSRLLLRLEGFASKVSEVSQAAGDKVTVDVYLAKSADAVNAQSAFLLCPVLHNWMMLATWSKAYPMGSSGTWQRAGVDYEDNECVQASAPIGVKLNFDVTTWFANDVKLRNMNYGLVLISTQSNSIAVRGDSDPSQAPRINWVK